MLISANICIKTVKEGKPANVLILICGVSTLVVNLYWIWHNARLYWLYHYTAVQFAFVLPDWVLFLHIISGALGLFLGAKIIRRKVSPLRGILFQLGIVIIWTFTELFYYDLMKFLDLF